jgi:hypothetical protein
MVGLVSRNVERGWEGSVDGLEDSDRKIAPRDEAGLGEEDDSRKPYPPPQLLKKRSVSRVTLFSGTGAVAVTDLTAA